MGVRWRWALALRVYLLRGCYGHATISLHPYDELIELFCLFERLTFKRYIMMRSLAAHSFRALDPAQKCQRSEWIALAGLRDANDN